MIATARRGACARLLWFVVPLLVAACSGPGSDIPPTAIPPPTQTPTPRAVATFVAIPTPTLVPPTATVPAPTPSGTAAVGAASGSGTASGTTIAGSGAAGTGVPTTAPPAYRIAFVSNRDGSDDIWTMDPDGRRLVNLTHKQKQKGSDSDPQWSPDGSRIVFVSDRSGQSDIWVMNQDGSAARNLTPGGGDDVNPRWSPDGKRIAFTSFRDADAEIYVMSADGGDQTNLSKSDGDDLQPVWSPDGTQIAFVSERGKRPRALYTFTVAAPKDPFRVTGPPCDLHDPVWSPDGKTLAVVGCVGADGQGTADATQHVVYTVPAAGGNLTAASDPKAESGDPVFTPDSRSLAFYTYRSPKEADIVILTPSSPGISPSAT
jgi:Tol biopolymer transport system component